MLNEADFWSAVDTIRGGDDSLKPEAYRFVMETLDFTMQRIGKRRHVTATELLDGFCGYARQRFGLLSATVLESWGITSTQDVGRAVFQLVDARVLSRLDSDRLEDFDVEYQLAARLEDGYLE